MTRARLGILSPGVYGRIKKQLGKVVCNLCSEPMFVYSDYVRLKAAQNSRAKGYHIKCAESVNIVYE